MDRRLWLGTQHPSLPPLTPYFFHSMLTSHTSQYRIAELQNSRSEITRKIRRQAWAGSARRDGLRASAARERARVAFTRRHLLPFLSWGIFPRTALAPVGRNKSFASRM